LAAIGHGPVLDDGESYLDCLKFSEKSRLLLRAASGKSSVQAQSIAFVNSSVVMKIQKPPALDFNTSVINSTDLAILYETVLSAPAEPLLNSLGLFL
jgi:hypothetical protein